MVDRRESRHAQTLKRGASRSSTDVRNNDQFKSRDIREFNLIFFNLAYRVRRAEVPLLADNFPKRAPAIGRPTHDELLRPRGFSFFKDKRYSPQALRLVKHEPNRLRPWFCGAPALRLSQNEGKLDRIVFLLRRDFNNGRTLDIEPGFTAGSNSL